MTACWDKPLLFWVENSFNLFDLMARMRAPEFCAAVLHWAANGDIVAAAWSIG